MKIDMMLRKRYHHIADPMWYYKQLLPFRMARWQRGGKVSLGKLRRLVAENLGPSAAPLVKKGIDYSLSEALAFGEKKLPKHAGKNAMLESEALIKPLIFTSGPSCSKLG